MLLNIIKKVINNTHFYCLFLPPVALAIRFKSAFLQRRTAIAPASTNCFKQRSSIPPVVKITFAPALSNFATRSLAISVSLKIFYFIFKISKQKIIL
jgi:hypothetical protein